MKILLLIILLANSAIAADVTTLTNSSSEWTWTNYQILVISNTPCTNVVFTGSAWPRDERFIISTCDKSGINWATTNLTVTCTNEPVVKKTTNGWSITFKP